MIHYHTLQNQISAVCFGKRARAQAKKRTSPAARYMGLIDVILHRLKLLLCDYTKLASPGYYLKSQYT